MMNTSGEILFCNQYLLDLTNEMSAAGRILDLCPIRGQDGFDLDKSGTRSIHSKTRFDAWEIPTDRMNNVICDGAAATGTELGEDITERTKAVETLRRYELLSKHARDIIFFIDRSGRIIEANEAAEKTYGYSRAEFQALSIADLRTARTQDDIAAQMAEAYERGLLLETEHRRKDGTTIPVEVSSIGVDIGGRRILLSIIRDITQRKRAEEELEKSSRSHPT
jgi:PAS domain S-box-containing protein